MVYKRDIWELIKRGVGLGMKKFVGFCHILDIS